MIMLQHIFFSFHFVYVNFVVCFFGTLRFKANLNAALSFFVNCSVDVYSLAYTGS